MNSNVQMILYKMWFKDESQLGSPAIQTEEALGCLQPATCDSGQSPAAPSPPLLTAGGWVWGLVPEAEQDLAVWRSG